MVGNPANTNALIAMNNAPDIPNERFTAMTRLDQNRAVSQLAQKVGATVSDVEDLVVWGNHSPTMFPDLFNAKVNGERRRQGRTGLVRERVHPARRQARRRDHRGARRLLGRAAANAAIDHVHDWVLGADGLVSMAVPSGGQYGVEEGLISSFPVRCSGGSYEIVEGLEVGDFAQSKIDATVNELKEERDAVKGLSLVG